VVYGDLLLYIQYNTNVSACQYSETAQIYTLRKALRELYFTNL